MTASATPTRSATRSEFPVRLQARVLAGLRTACTVSARLLRRLDQHAETPEDPSTRTYS